MTWVYIAILVIVVIYVLSYYRYPSKSSILQTSLNQFSVDALLEKQPIVVDDKNCNLKNICDTWFKFNPSSTFSVAGSDKWHMNRFKYNIVQVQKTQEATTTTPTEIYMCHPSTVFGSDGAPVPDTKLVAVQINIGQVLIIPFHWHYMMQPSDEKELNCVGVHDYITYLLP
jgi:hypothetical protein